MNVRYAEVLSSRIISDIDRARSLIFPSACNPSKSVSVVAGIGVVSVLAPTSISLSASIINMMRPNGWWSTFRSMRSR